MDALERAQSLATDLGLPTPSAEDDASETLLSFCEALRERIRILEGFIPLAFWNGRHFQALNPEDKGDGVADQSSPYWGWENLRRTGDAIVAATARTSQWWNVSRM